MTADRAPLSIDPATDYAPPLMVIQREQEVIYDLLERKRVSEAIEHFHALAGAVERLGFHLRMRVSR